MLHFDAILWDLDGTLVDSEPLHQVAILDVLGSLGIDIRGIDNRDFVGLSERDFWTHFRARFALAPELDALIALKERRFAEIIPGRLLVMPGVVDALEAIQRARLPMAIASGSTRATIRASVEAVGLRPYFRELVSSLDPEVPRSKPHPDVFLEAARRLDVRPDRCLVIEDAEWGVKAAKAANMRVLVVPNDFTRDHDLRAADWVLPSLAGAPIGGLLGSDSLGI